jgi:CBS domain containing-hemolysin-like protein
MIRPDLAIFPGFIVPSLLCLLLGSVFATLLAAYTLTGRVGVRRLAERYPEAEPRLAYWRTRWDTLRATMMLCSILMQVGVVTFSVLAAAPSHRGVTLSLAITLLAVTIAFALVFHTIPRALSLTYADKISVASLPMVGLLSRLMLPAAWPLARLSNLLHRLFEEGADEEHAPTPEDEIRSVVNRATTEDLEEEERRIIQSVFELGDKITREVMTPRVDLDSLEDTETVESATLRMKDSAHSRFPVYHETLDDIRGVAHVKDLLRFFGDNKASQPVMRAVKEIPFVPESMPINDLLTLLRAEKSQTAVVVDEYGGTAGLVTMEDVIEEVVGDIHDEYDGEEYRIQRLSDGSIIIDARLPVDKVNDLFDVAVPEDDEYDSVGGYVFHRLGRIPKPGEMVEGPGFQVSIQTANARQIHTLRLRKTDA